MNAACLFRSAGFLLVCAPSLAQPVLDRMEPRGAQAGGSARLLLSGDRLGPNPRLLTEAPITATPLAGSQPDGQMPPSELGYLVETDPAAAPGVYPLRIETSEGLSNALLFTVGTFPLVLEEESRPDADEQHRRNDFRATAEAIVPPVTVDGRLEGPERDVFRISAAKGQRLVAEVSARSVGSAIDPSLEILDSNGTVIARNSDAAGLGLDSRVVFEAQRDADYFVAVRDERFSSQDEDFYRLTVGEFEFADHVFPMGWTRGGTVDAEFLGGSLESPLRSAVELTSVPETATQTRLAVPGTLSFVPFIVSDSKEALEAEAGGMLEDGVVINGRIAAAGEVDRYRVPVQGGDQWAFELRSGELPGSSLYGVLTIYSGENVLAVAGKHAGDPNPYVITSTGVTATYPFVNLTVPPEASELSVTVEDLLGRGGSDLAYRLVARRQAPDFLVTINEPYLNIPSGGSAIVTVTAERRGYFGPIQLYLQDGPEDIEVSGGHIAPRSTLGNVRPRFETGRLTLTAKSGAKPGLVNLIVRGKATEEGHERLDRQAAGPGIKVDVKGTRQPPVTASWLGYGLPARINPEQPADLAFTTPRALRLVQGGKGLVAKWKYTARKAGVRLVKPAELPRNAGSLRLRRTGDSDQKESGEFRIFTHERTSLGMVNFSLSATVSFGGRDWTVLSKPLEVDVVDGYGLLPPASPLEIAAGGEVAWRGSIWRDPEFRRAVTVSAIGLPAGVSCQQASLEGDREEFELSCTADPAAQAGEYRAEIRAESVLSDEGTTKYTADPVESTVSVAR